MGPDSLTIISARLYKISCLALSAGFCWLGYRLFSQGLWGSGGDLNAKFKDLSLVLRNAAPGTFFAVLGAGIAVATVWRGFDIAHDTSQQQANIKPVMATEFQHPEKEAENPARPSTSYPLDWWSSHTDIRTWQAPPQKPPPGVQ